MIKNNIFRLASIIYADTNDKDISNTRIINKFIESVFIENGNLEITIDEIIDTIKLNYKLDFINEEIEKIVEQYGSNYIIYSKHIKLNDKRYETLEDRYKTNEAEQLIDIFIEEFTEPIMRLGVSIGKIPDILNTLFYNLVNVSRTQLEQLLNTENESVVLMSDLQLENNERELINLFLCWKNEEKDEFIFKIYNLGIEYSLITTNKTQENMITSISNKVFFLDCNIVFRGIGINGNIRKKRVDTFLSKCLENNEELKISRFTDEEFKSTVNHYFDFLDKWDSEKSFDRNLFKKLTKNDSIYHYFIDWKKENINLPNLVFKAHIFTKYQEYLTKFKINIEYKEYFNEEDQNIIKEIDILTNKLIEHGLKEKREKNLEIDAKNILLINKLRKENKINLIDTKYYLISADKNMVKLKLDRNQPISLYPSQWMGLLLKYTGRTEDDFKSFIGFLNLRSNEVVLSEKDAFIVSQAISSMAETLENQKGILNYMFESDFSNQIKELNNSQEKYDYTLKQAESYLEQELKKTKESMEIEKSDKEELKKIVSNLQNDFDKLKDEKTKNNDEKANEIEGLKKAQGMDKRINENLIDDFTTKEYKTFLIKNFGIFILGVVLSCLILDFALFKKLNHNPLKILFSSFVNDTTGLGINILSVLIEVFILMSLIKPFNNIKNCKNEKIKIKNIIQSKYQ